MNKFVILFVSFLLLLGAGCQKPDAPTTAITNDANSPEAGQNTEPFDTNDYLDQALEDLEAVE